MLASIEEIGVEKGMEIGMERGEKGGKFDLKQLNKKFGGGLPELDRILSRSDADALDRFGEAIFDFENIEDAEKWWNDPENCGNA